MVCVCVSERLTDDEPGGLVAAVLVIPGISSEQVADPKSQIHRARMGLSCFSGSIHMLTWGKIKAQRGHAARNSGIQSWILDGCPSHACEWCVCVCGYVCMCVFMCMLC